MRRFSNHMAQHPLRLIVTMMVPLIASALLAVIAIRQAVQSNKQRDVSICAQINQLKQDIYVSIIDIASVVSPQDINIIQQVFEDKFLPSENCDPE